MQQVAKVTGKSLPDLELPPFPDRIAHVWMAFLDLHAGRSYGMHGPNPLSWPDIKAWNDLMREDLKEWEIRAIRALDTVWLQVVSEGRDND